MERLKGLLPDKSTGVWAHSSGERDRAPLRGKGAFVMIVSSANDTIVLPGNDTVRPRFALPMTID